jgi:hypothetical protein
MEVSDSALKTVKMQSSPNIRPTEEDNVRNLESLSSFGPYSLSSTDDQLTLTRVNWIVSRWRRIGKDISEPVGSQVRMAVRHERSIRDGQ